MKKIIIYTVLIILAYYFFSVFFTKNGQFIQYYHFNSESKKESQEKNIFITDKLKVSILRDSLDIIKKSFDIWIDKNEVTRQYGFLPVRITSIEESTKKFNINFKEDLNQNLKDNLMLKVNNGDLMGNYTLLSQFVKSKDVVIVDFYMKNMKNSFGQIKVDIE